MHSKAAQFILTIILIVSTPLLSTAYPLADAYKDVPVLVTGGCGFIGSHLVRKLVDLGAHVTILDDMTTGNYESIRHVRDKVTLIQASITDSDACFLAVQGQKVIFHLAAFISVPQSMLDPEVCHAVNITGTLNLLEAARRHSISRFVFSSSAAVYDAHEEICREDAVCNPSSAYGYSKYIGELCCHEYATLFDLPIVILRYFNVYGQGQNPHGSYAAVVAKFKEQMAHNQPITIFGDGLQTRDFVPVERVVQANLIMGMAPVKKVKNQVFNSATGKSITLLELIDLLSQEYPAWNAGVIYALERPGDIKNSKADCSKYEALCTRYGA